MSIENKNLHQTEKGEDVQIEIEFNYIDSRRTLTFRGSSEDPSSVPPTYSLEGLIRRYGEQHRQAILEQAEEALHSAPDEKFRSKLERAISRAREKIIG